MQRLGKMSFYRLYSTVTGVRPLLIAPSQHLRSFNIASSSPIVRGKPLVTWIDKLKRWQSGSNSSKDETNSSDKDEKSEASSAEDLGRVLEEKQEALVKLEKDHLELKDKYMRALAEIENTRQRMEKQVKDAKLFGIQGFSKDMLDVADILEKAIETVPQDQLENDANLPLLQLFDGLKLTESQLQKVFHNNGLERINPLGEVFDPSYHEALFEVPGEKPGTIAVVSKVGYLLNGRTVRPALVGVAKAMDSKSEAAADDQSSSN